MGPAQVVETREFPAAGVSKNVSNFVSENVSNSMDTFLDAFLDTFLDTIIGIPGDCGSAVGRGSGAYVRASLLLPAASMRLVKSLSRARSASRSCVDAVSKFLV